MTIITYSDLPILRKESKDKKIVLCSGTFDLTHAGHIIFLEDCKKQGDILFVLVGNDVLIKNYKGDKKPILNQHVRLKMLDSLKMVDYVLLDRAEEWGNHSMILGCVFRKLEPDIYVVNEDGTNLDERKLICDKYGVKQIVLKRWCPPEFDNISTTRIIDKIKNQTLE